MNSGVYKITNTITGKIYVGSAANGFIQRWQKHKSDLKLKKHCNARLQNAYNKYGADVFEYEIIAFCPSEYVIKLEQFLIDSLKPYYNISPTAGNSKGVKRTEEYKVKLSKSRTGYKASDEFKEKCRKRMMGNSITKGVKLSDEHKAKCNPRGRKLSDETKLKMSVSGIARNYKPTKEQIEHNRRALCKQWYEILHIKTGVVITVDNLKKWCDENSARESEMHYSLSGLKPGGRKVNQVKGYRLISKTPKTKAA